MALAITLKSFHPTRLLLAVETGLLAPIVTYSRLEYVYGLAGVCLPATVSVSPCSLDIHTHINQTFEESRSKGNGFRKLYGNNVSCT